MFVCLFVLEPIKLAANEQKSVLPCTENKNPCPLVTVLSSVCLHLGSCDWALDMLLCQRVPLGTHGPACQFHALTVQALLGSLRAESTVGGAAKLELLRKDRSGRVRVRWGSPFFFCLPLSFLFNEMPFREIHSPDVSTFYRPCLWGPPGPPFPKVVFCSVNCPVQ